MAKTESVPTETEAIIIQSPPLADAPEPVEKGPELSFDLAGVRRERTTQAVRSAGQELEHLKKLLSAQDAAKLHAQSVAAQLQRELKSIDTDNNRMRGELKRSQDQLAQVKQEHSEEIYKASEREASLRNELLEARAQIAKVLDKASFHVKRWLIVAAAVVASAVVLVGASQWHSRVHAGASDAPADDAVEADVASPLASRTAPKPATKDFSGALGRLDTALDSFGGEKPETVLQRVHKENAARGITVCSFEWNDGQVSMLFGSKEGMDIDKAMSRCADAVEKAAK
jgi:hypothetical protein